MNGKVAKLIRKTVYGDELSPRFRKYKRHIETGIIIADEKRKLYQLTKKEYIHDRQTNGRHTKSTERKSISI